MRKIRLTEGQLNRVIINTAKRLMREMAYGVDFEDTIAWVQRKFPNMSPAEQERFARNIIAKKARQNGETAPVSAPVSAPAPAEPSPYRLPEWSEGEIVSAEDDEDEEDRLKYLSPMYKAVTPHFCYCHGELEDDLGTDLFRIVTKNRNLEREISNSGRDIILSYKGKKCIFRRAYSRMGRYVGLCIYESDPCKDRLDDLVLQHANH